VVSRVQDGYFVKKEAAIQRFQARSKLIYGQPFSNPSRTSRATLRANELFERAYITGRLKRLWSIVVGDNRDLKMLDEVDESRVQSKQVLERQAVRLEDIGGTAGKVDEYDIEFYPLHRRDRQRWVSVCVAMVKDPTQLAPVEMIQVGKAFYVTNGHHRVSVAKMLGYLFIDANITVWNLAG